MSRRDGKQYRIVMKNTRTNEIWYKAERNGDRFSQKKDEAYPFSETCIKRTLSHAKAKYKWQNIIIEMEEI